MIKQQLLGYKGMSKDLAKNKQSDKYFDAKNIRILATDQQSSFSVTNEHGNSQIFTIPIPVFNITDTQIDYTVGSTTKSLEYATNTAVIPRCDLESNYYGSVGPVKVSGTQTIIGVKALRDSAIIVSTDNAGFDCFWELVNVNSGQFDLNLLYMNDLSLSTSNLVQIEYNYENSIIQKIYFVDGKNQIRSMNIRQSVSNGDSKNLIDVPSTSIDTVSTFDLSQPTINSVVSGGNHTAGMVQYAYGLYILNGSQTTISPLSELVSLDKGVGLGGGDVNENVGRAVIVNVPDIDTAFTHIRIYAIKYTSFNEEPEVSLIADKEIDNFSEFTYYDDGSQVESVGLAAFVFLGSDPIIPKHIATKDNRLFPINIKEGSFEFNLDTRCYGHSSGGTAVIWENVYLNTSNILAGNQLTVDGTFSNVPEKHDAINKDYNTYKYQANGTTLGAEGLYFKVEIDQTTLTDSQAADKQFLKDREIYRIGVELYNRRGQKSDPSWMCDLQMPEGNLSGNYNKLKVTLKPEFYVWLNDSSNFPTPDSKPIGYKVLRADRTATDKTILTQGLVNPMIANYQHRDKIVALAERKDAVNTNKSDKMPCPVRKFQTHWPFIKARDYAETSWSGDNDSTFGQLGRGNKSEGIKSPSSKDWRAQNFQHSRLMQMFSPEILFDPISIDSSYELYTVGLMTESYSANWSTETNPTSGVHDVEAKFLNGISPGTTGVTITAINSNPNYLMDNSFFGPTNSDNGIATHQVYREFKGTFYKATASDSTRRNELYGTPELTERGADFTTYNNDANVRYCNHYKSMLIDDWNRSDAVNKNCEVQILGLTSEGAKCVTFMQGPDDNSYPLANRKPIETIHSEAVTGQTNGVLLCEFVKDANAKYIGSIYGGMTYEAKSISSYIGIGTYNPILTNGVLISSPGDTFVNTFTFTKTAKTDLEETSQQYNRWCEIVSIKVETTVDLKNRNDLSLSEWDNKYQPKYEDYQQYNRVYSQQPTLVQNSETGFKSKKIQEFDTRIMASKEKIPGESVDSWTDFLQNEIMDLDGQYGPINAVTNAGDEIYCLQDSGVAHISINPRVQTTGADGVAIELGTGGILHDYQYVTTKSGCLNKWGVVATQNGFYYIDILNKGIIQFNGQIKGLSDQEGFHAEFNNAMIYNDLVLDNAVASYGVSTGYNSVNNDVYFSMKMSSGSFTIAYNEATGSFVSYYDYIPAWYINKGARMISTNPNNNQVWEHFKGKKNHFYGVHHPSTIQFNVSPQGGRDVVFNNASYKMEMTNSVGTDLPTVGLTRVRVYNDYQDSGTVTLTLRDNMFKKFRHWKVNLPRQAGSRDRMRNPWSFIEFTFDNTSGNNMVLHDMTIHYTEY
tara:strand:+ start:4975 stop:9045 length:4071 start_codon:yes stop_codon:yes gene_type:complete